VGLGLREFPGSGRLGFLGFSWNLSSETSVFKGLRPNPRKFFSRCARLPKAARFPLEKAVETALRLALVFA
jgi:hypothetical protein